MKISKPDKQYSGIAVAVNRLDFSIDSVADFLADYLDKTGSLLNRQLQINSEKLDQLTIQLQLVQNCTASRSEIRSVSEQLIDCRSDRQQLKTELAKIRQLENLLSISVSQITADWSGTNIGLVVGI